MGDQRIVFTFRYVEKKMFVIIERFLKTQIPRLYPESFPNPRVGTRMLNRDERILLQFYGANWVVLMQEEIARSENCSVRTVGRVISRFRKFINQSGRGDWKKVLRYFESYRAFAVFYQ